VTLRSLAALDDATFDLTATEVVDAVLLLQGRVDEQDPRLGTVRRDVTLTVPHAVDVVIDSVGGTGELVLERIDVTDTAVTLHGVIPCTVVVTTSAPSEVVLDVTATPVAVRRWGRWRPWSRPAPESGVAPRP
jgi:hypothetical protein